jgi:hypothetical protein
VCTRGGIVPCRVGGKVLGRGAVRAIWRCLLPDAVVFTFRSARLVGHSYKAQIEPAGPQRPRNWPETAFEEITMSPASSVAPFPQRDFPFL